jgi:ABC-2 type transport system ATP-binding protein
MIILELDAVSKRYGRTRALRWIFLSVRAGEVVGLVGPNGAGKTTLLRLCAGLLTPSSGRVTRDDVRGEVRYFGGERTLPPNVREDRWRVLWSVDDAGRAGGTLGRLSRGSRQRLGLEATLAGVGRGLVLLDEPWEGLDLDAARWLNAALETARRRGAGVLVSSHRVHDLAAICDRCEFLVGGAIARSPVAWSAVVRHEARVDQLLSAYDEARRLQ